MRVVVSCNMRPRSESSGEDERVEFSIPPLDLFRRLLFCENRRVFGEESEDFEFCLDVRTGHGGSGKDEREGGKTGERVGRNEKKKTELLIFVDRHRSG